MTSGTVCLQGGAEFGPGSLDLDAALVPDGPVVVTALAGAPGREYATATGNGVRHYRAAGAADVSGAPDAREDGPGAVAALRRARAVVLPGGSPRRLLEALTAPVAGVRLADVLAELLADGGTVVGSSAGAMVLGAWTVLPEQRRPAVVRALGLAGDVLVVPHWSGPREDWLRAVDEGAPDDLLVLGLPEESGVVLRGGTLTAAGVAPTHLVRAGRDLRPGQSSTLEEARA